MPTRRTILLLTGLLVLAGSASVRAEDAAPRDYDRFDIRFGGGWVFGAETDVTLLGSSGIGTVIDFDKTLDGERDDSLVRVDGTWRMARRHSLAYSWYAVNRNGFKSIADDIEFGDTTFPATAAISSELDIDLHRFLYRYGLARTDQVDLDVGAGIYLAKVKVRLTADAAIGSLAAGTTKEGKVTAPLPTAGLLLNCKLTEKLSGVFSADWFYFAVNEWQGSQTDLQVGLEYRLARHWTLGAAYDRFVLDVEGPVKGGNFTVANAWNSLFSYIAFHW